MRNPFVFMIPLFAALVLILLLSACNQIPEPSPKTTSQVESNILSTTSPPEITPTTPAVSSPAPPTIENPVQPSTSQSLASQPANCIPTQPDALGPFYTPGAPERDRVGEGYFLTGVVRSAVDCQPIPAARIEFWLAGPDGQYSDDYRATTFAAQDGSYHFESSFPPPYSGRPSHIHILVSASGYQTLVTQHYPTAGDVQASLDLVLLPGP